jgi:hypothetical protein
MLTDSLTDGWDSLPITCSTQSVAYNWSWLLCTPIVRNGFDNVLILVDHLTRMPYFLPCKESVTTKETAKLFLTGVYRLHGLPRVLVSDRDPKFVNGLWPTL